VKSWTTLLLLELARSFWLSWICKALDQEMGFGMVRSPWRVELVTSIDEYMQVYDMRRFVV